jgi:hypothetical protein
MQEADRKGGWRDVGRSGVEGGERERGRVGGTETGQIGMEGREGRDLRGVGAGGRGERAASVW